MNNENASEEIEIQELGEEELASSAGGATLLLPVDRVVLRPVARPVLTQPVRLNPVVIGRLPFNEPSTVMCPW